jgi:hypothetical protein
MTDYLPVLRPAANPAVPVLSLTPYGSHKNTRALAAHSRQVDLTSRRELVTTAAMGEVANTQLLAEMSLLAHGAALAGDNEAMLFLVATKVANFSESNNARLRGMF